jgi:septal ring factor EnvC (AmiA/AmiB activator)
MKYVLILFTLFCLLITPKVLAQAPDDKLRQLQDQIVTYEKELTRLKGQSSTLSNQIAQYNAQIKLTELQISETTQKIELLAGRIDQLEVSLKALVDAFSSRVEETYKMARISQPFLVLASAPDISTAVFRFHYLKKVQEADRDLLVRLQSAQVTYKDEKSDQEDLQKKLEDQKKNLDSQKKAKNYLLQVTKSDEKKYQQLLASAKAEYEAIQAIIAGKGEETEIGRVSEGQRIASVIQGASCNSSGTHLHFIVRQGTTALNPFGFLKSIGYENCSGSSCGSSDGDSFNPSGTWEWPISGPITFVQGFGSTWAVRNSWVGRIYSFHNGIDVNGGSEVKAVKSGKLFRGSYGTGSCRLRYVRVAHDDSGLDTMYLHINY